MILFFTPPGHWCSHWGGCEVWPQTEWGPVGPQPSSMPHPRSLHRTVVSSKSCCSFPCHYATSPGQCREGCWICRTSAASHPADPGNAAVEGNEMSFKNLFYMKLETSCNVNLEINKMWDQQDAAESTWMGCWTVGLGLCCMMTSSQNITLSWSDGHKAICWSSTAETIPGKMTQMMNHKLTWTFTSQIRQTGSDQDL